MKDFEISVKKTIKNFDTIIISEEKALSQYDFHEEQFTMQEEMWTFAKAKRCVNLLDKLFSLLNAKYPDLFEYQEVE